MASPDEKSSSVNERNNEDSSSSGEWTLIGDKESADSISISNSIDVHDNDDDNADENIDAEEAREAIQILGESIQAGNKENEDEDKDKEEKDDMKDDEDKNRNDALVTRDDDSDGISVITDCEKSDDNLYRSLTEIIKPVDKIQLPAGSLVHILIACTLAATVGFGIGLFFGPGNTEMSPLTPTIPTNDVNFKDINTESEKSLYRTDELKEESHLLKDNIDVSVLNKPKINNFNVGTIKNNGDNKLVNIKTLKNNGSLREIIDKVKLSFNTLCSIIENGDTPHKTSIDFACNRRSLLDLLDLKDNLQRIMTGIQFTEENSNKRFIENVESKIKNISLTFFDDLSKTLKNSIVKVHRKLVKVRRKLNQRLCLIQNTMGDDPKLLELLEKLNLQNKNCNKPLKSDKFNEKITNDEPKKKNKPDKNNKYPVGPEVKREFDKEKSKMDSKEYRAKQNGRNDKGEYGEMKRKFKSQRDYHKEYSITDDSKSNDLNAKIIRDTAKLKPNAPPVDKYKDKTKESHIKNDDDSVCHSKFCSKQRNNDRKNSFEKNENWQFKRSEGRDNWRTEKKTNDKKEYSWDFKRAKGRENARTNV
ncbi:uncharacterized protein LOC103574115 [Microplitis demolitor]|uniref:uncharacterized protein LOC103574115 n=1 Tax=Microplitis demolitor TaxID=69319 RepID=UPI0004CCFFC2|nr:uncharacterized protein LOC103574115 [Microplitis demolitor]